MSEQPKPICPECADPAWIDRRNFIRVLGEGTAAVVTLGAAARGLRAADAPTAKRPEKPAEALIKELVSNLSDEQKTKVILPWNHGAEDGKSLPYRARMVNSPLLNRKISDCYSKPQQELVEQILRSICSGDEGYNQISRNGRFDSTGSFANAGALLFGNPAEGKYAMVFSSHHLTVRCDGNSEEGAAFGGPMYYGHSVTGDDPRNVYFYQTKAVLGVLDALDTAQREKAIVTGDDPGEHEKSIQFRKAGDKRPGIASSELSKDQKALIESAMRTILSPYRKEDANEVMDIIKANGGMDKINLAFFRDQEMKDNQRWHFWRLEGPGFVWNYRVLPHVHTFVNISSKV